MREVDFCAEHGTDTDQARAHMLAAQVARFTWPDRETAVAIFGELAQLVEDIPSLIIAIANGDAERVGVVRRSDRIAQMRRDGGRTPEFQSDEQREYWETIDSLERLRRQHRRPGARRVC